VVCPAATTSGPVPSGFFRRGACPEAVETAQNRKTGSAAARIFMRLQLKHFSQCCEPSNGCYEQRSWRKATQTSVASIYTFAKKFFREHFKRRNVRLATGKCRMVMPILELPLSSARLEQFEAHAPGHRLARLQCNHSSIHSLPLRAPWIGIIELVFDGHEGVVAG
jgi:hypothetical protein